MQIAAAYAPLVNGGFYLKPTIIAGTRDGATGQFTENTPTIIRQVFRPDTAEAIKDALFQVIETNQGLKNLIGIS